MLLGAAACDPFWTQQNGLCSDSMGNFIRQDGSAVPIAEIIRAGSPAPAAPTVDTPAHICFFGVCMDRTVGLFAAAGVGLVALKLLFGGRR